METWSACKPQGVDLADSEVALQKTIRTGRFILAVAYKTIANWLGRPKADENGMTSSVVIGVLSLSLLLVITKLSKPELVGEWLALPSLLKLLVPAVPIALVVWALEGNRRGWKWADEAKAEAPAIYDHGLHIAIVLICVPISIWIWVFLLR